MLGQDNTATSVESDLELYHLGQVLYLVVVNTATQKVQRILLERTRLISDHFYIATSITSSYQNEAEDIGHLNIRNICSSFKIQMSTNNIRFC